MTIEDDPSYYSCYESKMGIKTFDERLSSLYSSYDKHIKIPIEVNKFLQLKQVNPLGNSKLLYIIGLPKI